MGTTIDALRDTGEVVSDEPLVVVAAAATGVVSPLAAFVFGAVPLIGDVLFLVLIQPLLVGGMLHLGNRALDGPVEPETYFEGSQRFYRSLAGAFAIMFGIVVAFSMVVTFFAFFFAFVGLATGGLSGDLGNALSGSLGGLVLGFVVAVVLGLVLGTAVQFFDAAIVIGGENAQTAYTASWRTVKTNLRSVLGYTVLRGTFLLMVVLAPVLILFGSIGFGTLLWAVPASVVGYVGSSVCHALYYRRLTTTEDQRTVVSEG